MATRTRSGIEDLLSTFNLRTPLPSALLADPLCRPIDIYRVYLAETTSELLGCDIDIAYEAVQSANNKENGDLALILPKLKTVSENAKEIIMESLPKFKSALFSLPFADASHLRCFFSLRTLPRIILPYVHDRGEDYGRDTKLGLRAPPDASSTDGTHARKRVLVEFSSPKLASEFTSAHLRSTLLGSQIANLFEATGHSVTRINYLGDWGKDLGLLAVGWARFGSEDALATDPMGHLLSVYEQINALFEPEKKASKAAHDAGQDTAAIESRGIYAERDAFFKRLEDGDADAVALWRRFRDVTIAHYKHTYGKLNIAFDAYAGESQVRQETIAAVEASLKANGVYEESASSWILDYSAHGPKGLGVSVLRGRTGTSTYLLRHIAAAVSRHDDDQGGFDKLVYVAPAQQDAHFARLGQALRFAGRDDVADKLEHVGFGRVADVPADARLLGTILEGATQSARAALEAYAGPLRRDAEALGATALLAQDAGARRGTGYRFSGRRMSGLEGGSSSGPALQDGYARVCAKIAEVEKKEEEQDKKKNIDDYAQHLQEEPWSDVLRLVAQYPDVAGAAFRAREPSLVWGYLVRLQEELAQNCLCEEEEEEDDEEGGDSPGPEEKEEDDEEGGDSPGPEEKEEGEEGGDSPDAILAQAALYRCVRQVMENGMRLLGIVPMAP
ncbi:arginyl-tRNA synthetase [Xylariomycetidae sp. FL0641]|nr:arginyl-tRNA synthetase [Xylariomycetidae sp. FL0641]